MALKFQVRGTQLNAWYATGLKDWASNSANGQAPGLVANSDPGVFGGFVIDVRALIGKNAIAYHGGVNVPLGANFKMLLTLVPTWTGNPGVVHTGPIIGNAAGDYNQGFWVRFSGGGTIQVIFKDASNNERVNFSTASAVPWVSGVPTDIWIAWDGSNTANAVKVWYQKYGDASPTLIGEGTSSLAISARQSAALTGICIGTSQYENCQYYINEFCLFDDYTAPSGARRTDFISASEFEGYNTQSVSASELQSGVSKYQNGILVNGAIVAAAKATTKTGVAANDGTGEYDGSDRWSDPGEANVRAATAYKANSTSNNKTGTLDPVTVELKEMNLVSQGGLDSSGAGLVVTQGDASLFNLKIVDEGGNAIDLTGAVLTTKIRGYGGTINELDSSKHELAASQSSTGKGKFTLSFTASDSAAWADGEGIEIVTKVVQGSTVFHAHGAEILTVLPGDPQNMS